jgi:hypothetical protein
MFKLHIYLLVFLATAAQAGESSNYGIHQHYIAPRAMGMGNTFSGIDDYNVIFYNPAGLATLTKKEFNIGIGGAASSRTVDFGKEFKAIEDQPDTPQKDIDLSNFLASHYGEVYSARVPRMSFIYTRPRWGIAFIPVDLSAALMPHQLTGPVVDVKAYQDSTLAYGWAKATNNKKFSWGFLGKAIYRANIDRSFLMIDLKSDSELIRDDDFKEGMTVDADAGVMWMPFINRTSGFFKKVKPTFSAVVRNIADYGFTTNLKMFNDKSKVEPEKLQRRIDIGSKWELPAFSIFEPRIMIDMRDMLHDYWSVEKGLHIGGELKYRAGKALYGTLDAGLSQMLWTAGVGIQSYFFKIELTSFAEEYGTKNAKMSDRLYLAQLNFDF